MNINAEIARLEIKRKRLHEFIEMKLEYRDYEGIHNAASDLKELDAKVKTLNELETATIG